MELPRIPDFYRGERVFITGATGFMGKVLVEKLLRSCPELGTIYIVVRAKKNKTPKERWREASEGELFDRLRHERPGILEEKVTVLEGDVALPRLGLRDEDYGLLQDQVTQIFHVAASVRFDDALTDAVLLNTRGTHEMVKLALGVRNLKVVVHVSTTFCSAPETTNLEEVTPPADDWKQVIKLAERLDRREFSVLKEAFAGKGQNTYLFSKRLGESIIWDYRHQIPAIIMRPSVVVSSIAEPVVGYIENFNGPIGIILAGLSGLTRKTPLGEDHNIDYIPVDCAIQAMIIGAWHRAHRPAEDRLTVFNLSCPAKNVTQEGMFTAGVIMMEVVPLQVTIGPVSNTATSSKIVFSFFAIFTHLLPALLIDLFITLLRKKPLNLLRIQIKVQKAFLALDYFLMRHWEFPNDNYRLLRRNVLPEDEDSFSLDFIHVNYYQYAINSCIVAYKTLLKQDVCEAYTKAAKRRLNRINTVFFFVKCGFYYLTARFVHSFVQTRICN